MARNPEKVVVQLLRLVIAGVFMYAGVLKAMDPAQFAADVDNFRILSYPLACAMGVYLPWVEILGGAAFAFGICRSGAALLLGGLLVMFLIALGSAGLRGLDIACGCFGHSPGKSHLWISAALDVGLLAALCVTVCRSRRTSPFRASS